MVIKDEENRFVEIWLAHGDPEPDVTPYKAQGYKVAVYRSGSESLLENTAALLKSNM